MRIRKFTLGGAAVVALASLLSASPALAFTHHPATAEEIQQTDALNAQALANARMGTTAAQPSASTNLTTTTSGSVQTPDNPAPGANTEGDVNSGSTVTTPVKPTPPTVPPTPNAPTMPAPNETTP